MAVTKIKNAVSRAKRVARKVDKLNQKYGRPLDMIPYAPMAANLARNGLEIIDDFAGLMSSFSTGGNAVISGVGPGQVAGVSNGVTVRRSNPKFKYSSGTIRIQHKELIGSIANSTTLGTTLTFPATGGPSVYQVNATCGASFPWLSQIAANYDFYRFKRLRLVYVPLCATTETGRVMLGYDPDSSDNIPLDRQALSSYGCSTEASLWAVTYLDCRLSDNMKWYYSENPTVSASSSAGAFYDQGQLFAATWSGGSTNNVEELYVLYDVELKDPQPTTSTIEKSNGTAATVLTTFPFNSPIFNAAGTATSIVITSAAAGVFFINVQVSSTVTPLPVPVAGTGSTIAGNTRTTNATNGMFSVMWQVTAPGATLSFSGLTALANWNVYTSRANLPGDGVFWI